MANRFLDTLEKTPTAITEEKIHTQKESAPREGKSSNRFLDSIEGVKFENKDSKGKSIFRYLSQFPLGYLQKYTWPLNLLQIVGQGEALAELDELEGRIPELKKKFPNAPWENFKGIDREKYMQAVQTAGELFPTQQNIERGVESKTGIPLTPETPGQKKIRLAGSASGFRPGGLSEKATAAVVAPTVAAGLEKAGLSEGVSETAGLIASGATPSPKLTPKVKPSGMKYRNFEDITKPTKATPGRVEAIQSAVEQDFKKISEGILGKNKTYSVMKEDANFKSKIVDLFDRVENLSENIKGDIPSSSIKDYFIKKNKSISGITKDEFEKSFGNEVNKIIKDVSKIKNFTAKQLVEQYRKNNRSLRKFYEPGRSAAYNEAKKEALLEYNRAIEHVISEKYPNTEFEKLFKFTNKRWQEISDIEKIETFMTDLFDGKIKYGKAKQLLNRDKEHMARPFKRILGKEGFEDFKTLTEDLLSTENPMSYIKKAEAAGFSDLAKMAVSYVFHPAIAKGQAIVKIGKTAYKTILDKPKLILTWKSAFNNLKKGNYKQAEAEFNILDKSVNQTNHSKQLVPQKSSK